MLLPGRLPAAEMFPAGRRDLRSHFLELASGIRVRVVEAGNENAPIVLLIPGWACSAWIFHDTIAPLADAGFRAVAVDLRGHGLSDKPPERKHYTTEAMRDHVIEIIDALGAGRVRLVGHSMGGALVGHVAAAVPDRVESVVFAAPVGFAGVRGLNLLKLATSGPIAPLLPSLAARPIVKTMLGLLYGHTRPVSEKDVDEFWAPTQFPEFAHALQELLHTFDWERPFPQLSMPWMTMVGSRDRLCDPRDIGRYAGARGQGATIILPDVGHVLFDENPELVNGLLMSFFGGTA
jgi:Predicted hydrolases or acyltransferases (alpha/beta hydrolase superfamily)